MKLKTVLASTLVLSAMTGCIKHEIIPAPEPKVELTCHFKGNINNTDVELTQNVVGYFLETSKSKYVPAGGLPAEAIYYSEMKSGESLTAIKINMGTMKWDQNVSSDPTQAIFNGFFTANTEPPYAIGGDEGFELSYRDGQGNIWLSKDEPTNTIKFTNIAQESDKTGDYSKFVATFDATVYHTFMIIDNTVQPHDTTYDEQSRTISNAVFKGWFKR